MCSACVLLAQDDIQVNRYFIDGCLAVFDSPGEWTYDGDHLVVRLPLGAAALATNDETRMTGKDQTCVVVPPTASSIRLEREQFNSYEPWNLDKSVPRRGMR